MKKVCYKIIYQVGRTVGFMHALYCTIWALLKCAYRRSWRPLDELIKMSDKRTNDDFEKCYSKIFG